MVNIEHSRTCQMWTAALLCQRSSHTRKTNFLIPIKSRKIPVTLRSRRRYRKGKAVVNRSETQSPPACNGATDLSIDLCDVGGKEAKESTGAGGIQGEKDRIYKAAGDYDQAS